MVQIRVVQRGRSSRLAAKAFQRQGVVRKIVGKELQADVAAEFGVFGFVNGSHSPAAELPDNAVMGEGTAYQMVGGIHSRNLMVQERLGQ